jgi:hypothetical protein
MASDTSSEERLLRDVRPWLVESWLGLRFFVSVWVSVGLPSCLDRALAHRNCGFLSC